MRSAHTKHKRRWMINEKSIFSTSKKTDSNSWWKTVFAIEKFPTVTISQLKFYSSVKWLNFVVFSLSIFCNFAHNAPGENRVKERERKVNENRKKNCRKKRIEMFSAKENSKLECDSNWISFGKQERKTMEKAKWWKKKSCWTLCKRIKSVLKMLDMLPMLSPNKVPR